MPTIGWDENSPPDSESAGLGDDRIRSLKTSVRIGLDGEHVWPSSGGDAGVHRFGSARPYYGTQSAVSSSGSDGRLMLTSDTSRLFAVGLGGTVLLGDTNLLSVGTTTGIDRPQRAYWAVEFGSNAEAAQRVTYPNSGFSGRPIVTASIVTTLGGSGLSQFVNITVSDATGFFPRAFNVAGAELTNARMDWISIGTRAL